MPGFSLISDRDEGQLQLMQELQLISSVSGVKKKIVIECIAATGITTLQDLNHKAKIIYESHIDAYESDVLTPRDKVLLKIGLSDYIIEGLSAEYAEVLRYIPLSGYSRCMGKRMMLFLIRNRIKNAEDITYELREKYEIELNDNVGSEIRQEYLSMFDRVKLDGIREKCSQASFKKKELIFTDKKIFLLYYPDIEIAESFRIQNDKTNLVFDFSLPASDTLKKQIIGFINYILKAYSNHSVRKYCYLLPLKVFFENCYNMVEDINQIEEDEIQVFEENYRRIVPQSKVKSGITFIDRFRRYVFLTSEDICWDANTWYPVRFQLMDSLRVNEARPIESLNFTDIKNRKNRNYFKRYMKYLIGLTDLHMQTVRCTFYRIKQFLRFCDDKGLEVGMLCEEDIREYSKYLNEKDCKVFTYNKYLVELIGFLKYSYMPASAEKLIRRIKYSLKPERDSTHHNRAVSRELLRKLLMATRMMDRRLALIFMSHLGLVTRISEVCTLKPCYLSEHKGEAYYAYLQKKIENPKEIIIPYVIYESLMEYVHENNIGPDEYIFQNKVGEAADAGSTTKAIKKAFRDAGITEYDFRSHDMRHTVAFLMFNEYHISLAAIRETLGHRDEQMTLQYLDYLEYRMEEELKEYHACK